MSTFLLCLLAACGNDGPMTVCKPGTACEKRTLHQCECCAADQIEACKSDRKEACATGQLNLEGTPEECASFNNQWEEALDRGEDPCSNFEADPVEEYCATRMMDSFPGGG